MSDLDPFRRAFLAVAQRLIQLHDDIPVWIILCITGVTCLRREFIHPDCGRSNAFGQRLQDRDFNTVHQSLQCLVFGPKRIGLRGLDPSGLPNFDHALLLAVDGIPAGIRITVLFGLFGQIALCTPRPDHLVVTGNGRPPRPGPEIEPCK